MITTVELPADVQPGDLLNKYRHTLNVAVVVARFGAKNADTPLLRDVILATCLGRGTDEIVVRNQKNLRTVLTARLIGQRVHTVLVTSAENLTDDLLDLLALQVTGCGCRLVLAYGYDSGARVRAWGARLMAPDIEWDDLVLPEESTAPMMRVDDPFPDEVPFEEFPLFRTACRRLLPPDDFSAVDAVYVAAFRRTKQQPPSTSAEAAALLRELIRPTDKPAKAVTVARAVQAACLTCRLLLKVDAARLHIVVGEGTHDPLSDADFVALLGIPEPELGVVPMLADLGMENDDIIALTIGDAPEFAVGSAEEAIVRNQMAHRYLQGAQLGDPLVSERRAIRRALTAAGREGIAVDAGRVKTAKPDRWQQAIGVNLLEF